MLAVPCGINPSFPTHPIGRRPDACVVEDVVRQAGGGLVVGIVRDGSRALVATGGHHQRHGLGVGWRALCGLGPVANCAAVARLDGRKGKAGCETRIGPAWYGV